VSTPRRNWEVGKKAQRMCTEKVRHPDDYVARIIAQELLAAGLTATTRLFTYRCALCRGWHLTKLSQPRASSVVASDLFYERRG
jgi:hypothetical protein